MFKIKINNKEIKLYESFTISKTLSNFVDTFSIKLGNPGGLYSRTISVGSYINIYWEEIEIFRGICEKKNVAIGTVGFTLNFSGREELLLITEDDISPLKKSYKNVSDNFIIKDVCKGYGWEFELATEKIIKEYEIPNNGVRKGSVVESVASSNNFYIYKIGNTIYKKALPAESDYTERKSPQLTLSTQGGGFVDYNNRILDVDISEDITGCKSTLKGFTYGTGKTKPKLTSTIENPTLLNGTYPQRLRNISDTPLVAPIINRFVSSAVPVKAKKELDEVMKKSRIENDIKIELKITITDFLDLHILDTVEVFIQDEDIKQYFYITALSYNYDSSNKFYTSYTLSPIIPIELE